MMWQKIETAPKDNTEVIGLFCRSYDGEKPTIYGPWTMRFEVTEWVPSWDGDAVIDYQSDFGTDYKSLDLQPTHWQPMPTASDVD